MLNQKGSLLLAVILLLTLFLGSLIGIVVYKLKDKPTLTTAQNKASSSASPTKEFKWQSTDKLYEYTTLPNGTRLAKVVFTNSISAKGIQPLSDGKNAIDGITIQHLFGNPLYHANDSIYNQELYNSKTDPIFNIKIQNLFDRQVIFFTTTRPPSNLGADLHLYDEDLHAGPEVEGVLVQLSENTILEFVHYKTPSTTIEDYKNDHDAYIQVLKSFQVDEALLNPNKDEKTLILDDLTFTYPKEWKEPTFIELPNGKSAEIFNNDNTARVIVVSGFNRGHSEQELSDFLNFFTKADGRKLTLDDNEAALGQSTYQGSKAITVYVTAKDKKSQYSISLNESAEVLPNNENEKTFFKVLSTLKFIN